MKSHVYRRLDTPRFRPVLAALASAYLSVTEEPCIVRPMPGGWLMRYRSGRFSAPSILPRSPAGQRQDTADIFFWDYRPQSGDTVLDVGAGVGTEVTGVVWSIGQTGLLIAVEAHPRTCEFLERNIMNWGYDNVMAVCAAVTDRSDGTVKLRDDDLMHHLNTMVGARSDFVTVPAMTMDALVTSMDLTEIDFLKMNIEGAEVLALEGGRMALQRTRHVAVSCHDFRADRGDGSEFRTKDRVTELLSDAGFALKTRSKDHRDYVRDVVYGRRIDS